MISLRALRYFNSIETLGELLLYKLFSMILVTLFSMLIFSSILTALSKLYLSKDLHLVHAMPVPSDQLFFARWIESTMDSAWMVIVYSLPFFISYGIVFNSGYSYYAQLMLILGFLSIIASGISALVVMLAVIIIPANRIRSLFVLLGLCVFIVLFLAFRMLRPERLVDPDVFVTVLTYFQAMQTPTSPFIPSTWAFDALKASLNGNPAGALIHLGLLFTFAGFLVFANLVTARFLYYRGFSKSQSANPRLFKFKNSGILLRYTSSTPIRAFVFKEIKTFIRDQTQWSQIFLIGALIIIYIYNFKVLPVEKSPIGTLYMQNLLSFLNVGLAAFVLTAIAGRFAYPAISNENEAFWIVRSSPITLRQYMWVKFVIYFTPLLVLTEILIVTTNILLKVTPFMMVLSVVTIFFMVPAVVALSIGLGAAYPNFKSENPAQSLTSYGGLVFMTLSAGLITAVLLLEAGPVYNIFMADIRHHALGGAQKAWNIGSFSLAFLINMTAILVPMRFGEKRLAVSYPS